MFTLFFIIIFLGNIIQPNFILRPDGLISNAWCVSGPPGSEEPDEDVIEDDGEDEDHDHDPDHDHDRDWEHNRDFEPDRDWPFWAGPAHNSTPGADDHGASDDEREEYYYRCS